MSNWDKISLFKFQQVREINYRETLSPEDKILFSVCAVFDMTEYQLDNTDPVKATKLINRVSEIFATEPDIKPLEIIGDYEVNYNPGKMTLGQYVTLAFYISRDSIISAHKILATITNEKDLSYDADLQDERSEFFLKQPVTSVLGAVKRFNENFRTFNEEYSNLFGVATEDAPKVESDPFHKRYGWVFSATMVADHNRVSLDEAYALPIRVAFNDLAYLKAKSKYDESLIKIK